MTDVASSESEVKYISLTAGLNSGLDHKAAHLLFRISVWWSRAKAHFNGEPFIANPLAWWQQDANLSPKECKTRMRELRERGFIRTTYHQSPFPGDKGNKVSFIQLTAEVFDDGKVKRVRRLPPGRLAKGRSVGPVGDEPGGAPATTWSDPTRPDQSVPTGTNQCDPRGTDQSVPQGTDLKIHEGLLVSLHEGLQGEEGLATLGNPVPLVQDQQEKTGKKDSKASKQEPPPCCAAPPSDPEVTMEMMKGLPEPSWKTIKVDPARQDTPKLLYEVFRQGMSELGHWVEPLSHPDRARFQRLCDAAPTPGAMAAIISAALQDWDGFVNYADEVHGVYGKTMGIVPNIKALGSNPVPLVRWWLLLSVENITACEDTLAECEVVKACEDFVDHHDYYCSSWSTTQEQLSAAKTSPTA